MKPLAIANGFTMFSSSNSIWCKDTVLFTNCASFWMNICMGALFWCK